MAQNTKRITLVIHNLAMGGAERVVTLLANHLVEHGNQVRLICMDDGRTPPFFPVAPRVTMDYLGLIWDSRGFYEALTSKLVRLRALRAAIRRSEPSVVISFIDTMNIRVVLATTGLGIPVLVRECTYPAGRSLGRGWEFLRAVAYRRAQSVVAFNRCVLECFSKGIQNRGCVISDAITIPPAYRGRALKAPSAGKKQTVIGLGRLHPIKGFDLLITAFAAVCQRFPDWSLEIWGEGGERANLERLARELNVSDRVRLPGLTNNPAGCLAAADLFVLPSRVEGFGQALGEAMACGLPVLSFACPSGPPEIIRDGVDGILVPSGDVSALAHGMERLMGDETLRRKLATRAPEVLDRFSLENVMGNWERLIERVALK